MLQEHAWLQVCFITDLYKYSDSNEMFLKYQILQWTLFYICFLACSHYNLTVVWILGNPNFLSQAVTDFAASPCENTFLSLFFFVNLQFSNHAAALLRGLSCGLLYRGTKHTEQSSVYGFCPPATFVQRKKKYRGALFLCPWGKSIFGCLASTLFVPVLQTPSINFILRSSGKKKHWFIGLTAFLDINSEKTNLISGGVLVCVHSCSMSGV